MASCSPELLHFSLHRFYMVIFHAFSNLQIFKSRILSMAELKNRQAFHEYFIEARYEAGIVLLGTEVKSLREGKMSFNDAYCLISEGEIWMKSLHIAEYSHGTVNNHDPIRDRKLLLQKREIKKIEGKMKEKGFTIVPLRIFFN